MTRSSFVKNRRCPERPVSDLNHLIISINNITVSDKADFVVNYSSILFVSTAFNIFFFNDEKKILQS